MEYRPFALSESCFRYAVDKVLRNSTLPSARLEAVLCFMVRAQGGNLAKQAAAMGNLVGAHFSWPWFDAWATRFAADGTWPQYSAAWGWIEAAAKPERATAAQYLRGLRKSELLTLADRRGVAVSRTCKVADLRYALIKNLGRAGLESEIAGLECAMAADAADRAAREKLKLLVISLYAAAFARHRLDQIAGLMSYGVSRYRVYLDPGHLADAWVVRLCRAWVFDPTNPENLPPFFPGAPSSIRTERLQHR